MLMWDWVCVAGVCMVAGGHCHCIAAVSPSGTMGLALWGRLLFVDEWLAIGFQTSALNSL